MTEPATDPAILDAVELLARYSFDLGTFASEQLVDYWLRRYPATWVRSAVIEALYQGRYKAVSVGQILAIWGRRGQPIYHYNSEFERIVSNRYLTLYPPKPNAPTQGAGEMAAEAEVEPVEEEGAIADAVPPDPVRPEFVPPEPESHAGNSETCLNRITAPPPSADSWRASVGQGILLQSLADFPLVWHEPVAEEPAAEPHAGSPEIWVQGDARKHPIHRFVPDPEGSWFYIKLRAVAYDDEFPGAADSLMLDHRFLPTQK